MFQLFGSKNIFISRTGLIWYGCILLDCVELVVRHHNSAIFIPASTATLSQLLALKYIDVTSIVVPQPAQQMVDWHLSFSAAGTPMISKIGHHAFFIDSANAERIIGASIY
jgi:hypothetical protein